MDATVEALGLPGLTSDNLFDEHDLQLRGFNILCKEQFNCNYRRGKYKEIVLREMEGSEHMYGKCGLQLAYRPRTQCNETQCSWIIPLLFGRHATKCQASYCISIALLNIQLELA